MTLRSFIGLVARRVFGDNGYWRLRSLSPDHSYLRNVRGVIHVGANTGQERHLYSALGLAVIWIEPIPEVFAALQANILALPKQLAFNNLIAEEDGRDYQLHVANNDGASSSILDLAKHQEMCPDVYYRETINLKGITLTSLIAEKQIDIRKFGALVLDTQGSELKILKGAIGILSNFEFVKAEAADFESYKECCLIDELATFLSHQGFREQRRHANGHMPGVGTYFDATFRRINPPSPPYADPM
jgi:FkbM family methyltransferase